MRNYALMAVRFISGLGCVLSLGCGPKPTHRKLANHVNLPPAPEKSSSADDASALWFTTSNYTTGGTLGRLDLKTGAINRAVMTVSSDTQIFADGQQGLFLLSRIKNDGVTLLKGPLAHVSVFYSLPKGSNPQHVLRDREGRVWVTLQESNDLLVLSSDLTKQETSINLRALALSEEPGALGDLAHLYQVDEEHIAVTAQRLHRSVRAWKPDAQSGFAVINSKSLIVESTQLLVVPNPIKLGRAESKVVIIGGGDFSTPDGATAKLLSFAPNSFTESVFTDLGGKVLAADLSVEAEAPTMIVWYPNQNKSCVQLGSTKIICEGNSLNEGYVFNAIHRIGSRVFVSYYGADEAQMWLITLGQATSVQKIPMDLPIISMSGGL